MVSDEEEEEIIEQSCNAMQSTHSTESTVILIDYAKATVLS